MMKVAICGVDPESIHYRTYVEYLASRGHDVTVITNRYEMDADVKVVNFCVPSHVARVLPGRTMLPRLWRLWRALHRERFDVLDIMQVGLYGVYAAWFWRGPLVLNFWGSDILRVRELRSPWIRFLMRRVIRKADRIHSVSRHMTEVLVAAGADEACIETFQYGVDVTQYDPSPHRKEAGRVLSSRGLRPFYRLETIVQAMALAASRRSDAHLAVTGTGPELEELQALASSLGVAENVIFLGHISREELAEELARASVWVSVPPSDGAPLSLLEAMAGGALPVVSDLDTMHEWLDESRAVFVKDVTPPTLADALLRAFELAAGGAHAALNRRVVEERGDRARNLPRWEEMLAAAARGRRRRA